MRRYGVGLLFVFLVINSRRRLNLDWHGLRYFLEACPIQVQGICTFFSCEYGPAARKSCPKTCGECKPGLACTDDDASVKRDSDNYMYPQDPQNGAPQNCADVERYCSEGRRPCCEHKRKNKWRECDLSAINLNKPSTDAPMEHTALTAGWMTISNVQAVRTPTLCTRCVLCDVHIRVQVKGAAICAYLPDSVDLFRCTFSSNTAEVFALHSRVDVCLTCCLFVLSSVHLKRSTEPTRKCTHCCPLFQKPNSCLAQQTSQGIKFTSGPV